MRTYHRNVRRAWDGDEYHAPKRQRVEEPAYAPYMTTNENNVILMPEDNLERAIRETSAALSSSPSRKNSTVFSLDPQDAHQPVTLTPPSSPPPMLEITPPAIRQHKSSFSAVEKKRQREKLKNAKRKRDDGTASDLRDPSEPLSEIMNSSRGSAAPTSAQGQHGFQPVQPPLRPVPTLQKSLTQTVLDFGQANTPVTCTQCQMSYTPSVVEDTKLHNMFHSRHQDGIELDKAFMKSAMKWCYEVPNIPGSVVVVDRKISLPARKTVQKVLEVVNKELGSVEIPESELWGQKALEGDSDDTNTKKVDCYKVFLHIINGKCVAVCLAERIAKAYKVKLINSSATPAQKDESTHSVQEGTMNKDDSALLTPTSSSASPAQLPSSADLQLDDKPLNVLVGVSRIWTSKTFRKKGIANNLLDCVVTQFIYGMDIEKEEVAFSQPTDMGTALARNWVGAETGWNVYKED